VFTPLITLSPIGGLAHLGSPLPHPRADVFVSAAGPAVHLAWLALVWPLSVILPAEVLRPEGWAVDPVVDGVELLVRLNVALLLFNLLPLFPMDGGRILRALLASRMQPNRATRIAALLGIAGAVAFVVVGVVLGGYWSTILIVIGLSNFFACQQELVAARHGAGPYDVEALEPWQSDPDAWRRGESSARPKPPGFFVRRREARARRRAAAEVVEAAALEAEVDRVLGRVCEVGMEGLTRAERATLERASRRKRERR
jgi:hypothetical protein